jgi:hypothetical protein
MNGRKNWCVHCGDIGCRNRELAVEIRRLRAWISHWRGKTRLCFCDGSRPIPVPLWQEMGRALRGAKPPGRKR